MSVISSNSSPPTLTYYCLDCREALYIFNSFIVAKLVLCGPLSVLILHLAYWKWRSRPCTRTTPADLITYHAAALELSTLSVCPFYFYASYTDFPVMATVSLYILSMAYPGEISLNCLTSVERYLAVVHPIFYRRLRQSGGVIIRNAAIGCSWLLCFEWIHLKTIYNPHFPTVPFFSFLAVALLVVSFCSLSVLFILIRPGPGDEKRVDQTKQKAFNTVVAILTVLWMWFVGILVSFALASSALLSYNDGCTMMMSGMWFCVPSSLVLPLLFLHRTEKLTTTNRSKNQSRQVRTKLNNKQRANEETTKRRTHNNRQAHRQKNQRTDQ